jgi:hypothetical protein
MLGSAALGTAVGLVVLFAVTALLCSGVTEAVSNFTQLRARYLLTGLRAMLDAPESGSIPDGETRTEPPDRATKKALHEAVKDPTETHAAAKAVTERVRDASNDLAVGSPFTLALFDNPMIKSLQTRKVGGLRMGKLRNPQYISSQTFTRALVDTLLPDAIDPRTQQPGEDSVLTKLYGSVKNLPEGPLKQSLLAFITQAAGSLEKFETSVELWYDDQMARISGWYKRWSRVVLGVVGFVVAVLINIDTVQVSHALYVDAPLRQAVQSAADSGTLCQGETSTDARAKCAQQELDRLKVLGLPLGYPSGCKPFSDHPARCFAWSSTARITGWDFWLKLLGWLVTAFAVSFGAPFWFDALSKLGSLRNSGAKPQPSQAA